MGEEGGVMTNSTYMMPDETLEVDQEGRIGCCMACGEETNLVWCGPSIPFCSLDCLDKYAREWAKEMNETIARCEAA